MSNDTVAFVGGGNMTRAIAGGLLEHGFSPDNICIAEPNTAQREVLRIEFAGVFVTANNDAAVARADNVVLAVKPQIIAAACKDLAAAVQTQRPLIISIAAGPRSADIDSWLGGDNAIIRAMPNQPALLRAGVSGMHGNAATSEQQMAAAKRILSAIGPVVEVPNEADIDAVTAVSGSGPAYFYLLIDMLATTGTALGLNATDARQLAIETAVGAAALAKDSDESMRDLIARVRSPGGTTAAALDSLDADGVRDIFGRALTAARDRAAELADIAHRTGKQQE